MEHSVFGSKRVLDPSPSDTIPQHPTPPEVAYQMVKEETYSQTNPMLNLATFVTTYMDKHATKLMNEAININYIDETDKVVALLYGSENQRSLVYDAIYSRSNSFSDSPLVIKTLCNQQKKTADRIFRFLKNLLLYLIFLLRKNRCP